MGFLGILGVPKGSLCFFLLVLLRVPEFYNKLTLLTGAAPCQGQWQQLKYTLIMYRVLADYVGKRSWTSKVFKAVITLDTYQSLEKYIGTFLINVNMIMWKWSHTRAFHFELVKSAPYHDKRGTTLSLASRLAMTKG